jgi:Trypsin-like peptidase domain
MAGRARIGARAFEQAEAEWSRVAPQVARCGASGLLLACALSACSSHSEQAADLPHFREISEAPAAIANSAHAVVRIETATASGTGSFISSTGLLLTNNHVLGAPVCPIEGCYIELSLEYQRGEPRQASTTVFALPKAVDLGLDVAIVQIFLDRGGAPFPSPNFLSANLQSASDLLGKHIFVVGHPEGSLKHWTDGTVVDTEGEWFKSTAFILPGDSGSPVLDDEGKLVGLMHRGPTSQDLVTSDSVDTYSLGSPSATVLAVQSAPLPVGMISVDASTNAASVLANEVVFLNGKAPNALIDAQQTSVLSLLGQACDAALARTDFVSIDDMNEAQTPCFEAMAWLECRSDLKSPPPSSVCVDSAAWAARFQLLNQAWVGQDGRVLLDTVSFFIAHLSDTYDDGITAGRTSLSNALATAQTPLDLTLSPYLAAFQISQYGGTDVTAYVRNYRQVPHYELSATNVANAAAWLYDSGAFTKNDLAQMLSDLAKDSNVSLGTKLLVEELQYDFGLVN